MVVMSRNANTNAYFGIVALGAALGGCANRAPLAVAPSPHHYLNCTAILAEFGANNHRLKHLAAEKGLRTTQNGNANIPGMFVPVLWFIDFQDTADTEITTLQSRQRYLLMMADQKRCGADLAPRPNRLPK